MTKTSEIKFTFNPLFNFNMSKGQDRRTASVNALCSMFNVTPSKLKVFVESASKKASHYNLKKTQATKNLLLNGDKNYDDTMIQIDRDFDLTNVEWFILKEFRESIQLIDFIK